MGLKLSFKAKFFVQVLGLSFIFKFMVKDLVLNFRPSLKSYIYWGLRDLGFQRSRLKLGFQIMVGWIFSKI